jgi:predicted N-formylglutamate amidohydrolase
MKEISIIVSCEHAGNDVPKEYTEYFDDHQQLLQSHRGWDIGAYDLAKALSVRLKIPVFAHHTTRLLVDINRSLYRRTLFSEITKQFGKEEKLKILNHYYYPYRNKIEKIIMNRISNGNFVLHISIHSFTPVLKGSERKADIGVLYNPERVNERGFAKIWKLEMNEIDPGLKIRFNYPYQGKPDGFPAFFRKKYNDNEYAGYEFEVNQKFYTDDNLNRENFEKAIIDGFISAQKKFSLLYHG